ncbi:Retrovirus-related Pol polyprotein from transposon, partial [Dictyocoela muelleri]
MNFKIPKTIKEICSFIGFSNYFHKFIKNYAEKMIPLYDAVKNKKMNDNSIEAFKIIIEEIKNIVPLHLPDLDKTFIIYCDASNLAVGATLCQNINGKDMPIYFFSKKIASCRNKLYNIRKRMFINNIGDKTLETLHLPEIYYKNIYQSLIWLSRNISYSQRLTRWKIFLQD